MDTPFDIGIPYANPICLYPPNKVGMESDWDGELFGALGMQVMLFETESFSVRSLLKGYGDNNVDGPNQYGSLRYTGLNKIPTISECFPYWKNAFPNLPVPSSIKETEPSKI